MRQNSVKKQQMFLYEPPPPRIFINILRIPVLDNIKLYRYILCVTIFDFSLRIIHESSIS